ncbi:MAG: cytochrome c3 family protein [Candidatus Omnitrophica bacterium]|nr:cytochrome c3 family protein [Candidatus Omnitrophota bacterium]
MQLGALAVVGAWGLLPLVAEAVTGSHNMSSKAPGGQVCIVCHAPHGVPKSPLLWNHVLSANNYSWSDWVKTTGDTTLPTNIQSWSGSTKMCLSCHDGTVALGALADGTVFDTRKMTGHNLITTPSGDLKGNHPVAIPYPYNRVKNTYNGITTGDLAMQSGWVATPTKVKIYIDAAGGANNRGIECASCHDPHGTANPNYLRDSTSGSALCLDCHTK